MTENECTMITVENNPPSRTAFLKRDRRLPHPLEQVKRMNKTVSSKTLLERPVVDSPALFAEGSSRDLTVRIYREVNRSQVEMLLNSLSGEVVHTPFQALAFLEPFYAYAGANTTPLLMEVARAGQSGSLMLMPLLMRQSHGITKIEGADLGLADYVAPIAVEGFKPSNVDLEAIRQALLAALPQADLLSFKKMPRDLGTETINPFALLQGSTGMGISTKVLDLRDPACLSHYRRAGIYKDGMRQLRRLQKKGMVEFRVAATAQDADLLFAELVDQRLARFEAAARPDPLTDSNVQDFYRTMICSGVPKGKVLFAGLFMDGVCIATDLGLVQDDTHFGIFTTMRSGPLNTYSPGTIAFMMMLDETVARGIDYYDIGVGEFPYKDRLKGQSRPLYEWNKALTVKGHIAVADLSLRRNVRVGLKHYPALRQPAMWLRKNLHSLRKWVATASLAVVEWPAVTAALPMI
jgi:CelD/BcsL family acetyltransferase involved in cellulose biosynthesis